METVSVLCGCEQAKAITLKILHTCVGATTVITVYLYMGSECTASRTLFSRHCGLHSVFTHKKCTVSLAVLYTYWNFFPVGILRPACRRWYCVVTTYFHFRNRVHFAYRNIPCVNFQDILNNIFAQKETKMATWFWKKGQKTSWGFACHLLDPCLSRTYLAAPVNNSALVKSAVNTR
jgi:hypothetical protein